MKKIDKIVKDIDLKIELYKENKKLFGISKWFDKVGKFKIINNSRKFVCEQ